MYECGGTLVVSVRDRRPHPRHRVEVDVADSVLARARRAMNDGLGLADTAILDFGDIVSEDPSEEAQHGPLYVFPASASSNRPSRPAGDREHRESWARIDWGSLYRVPPVAPEPNTVAAADGQLGTTPHPCSDTIKKPSTLVRFCPRPFYVVHRKLVQKEDATRETCVVGSRKLLLCSILGRGSRRKPLGAQQLDELRDRRLKPPTGDPNRTPPRTPRVGRLDHLVPGLVPAMHRHAVVPGHPMYDLSSSCITVRPATGASDDGTDADDRTIVACPRR